MNNVIVVDDEQWNREIIKRFGQWELLNLSIVSEASDGAEAIEQLHQYQPDIVITDMKMPGVDGSRLMEYIREHYPDVQLIVISGYDDFDYARKALRCNAVEYLLKPVSGDDLNDALRKCISNLQEQQAIVDVSLLYAMTTYKKKIEQAFEKLTENELDQVLTHMENEWSTVPKTIKQQLQDELAGYAQIIIQKYGITSNLASAVQPGWDDIKFYYRQLLQALIDQRKYKSKLNLLDIKSYIESNAKQPIMLEELANTFFVSKEYLSKQFKHEFGISMTDYIVQLRMDEAKLAIEEGKLSFKEIAEQVGYEDLSYFYRVFRKYYGIAPGEMRKQYEV